MKKWDYSAPGPTPSSMVPLVPMVHLDSPWSAISGVWLHKVDQAGPRWPRSGPGELAEPWSWVLNQERSGPPWLSKKHFPDAGLCPELLACGRYCQRFSVLEFPGLNQNQVCLPISYFLPLAYPPLASTMIILISSDRQPLNSAHVMIYYWTWLFKLPSL